MVEGVSMNHQLLLHHLLFLLISVKKYPLEPTVDSLGIKHILYTILYSKAIESCGLVAM